MTHFNLNRMLQGCSAFIQTMAGERAARNDAKRVNNHVLPLTCLLLASSLRLTCPLQLRRIALILCVLVLSVGQMWGETATFSGDNLNAAAGDKTVGSITLSTSNMTYSSGLVASSSGKSFTVTTSGDATISQVLITMNGTSNRYNTSSVTNCTSCTRDGSVYTCIISPAVAAVTCTTDGGGVTVTQIVVTYTSSGGGGGDPATGTGTVTYTLTAGSDAVSGAVSGVTTLTASATSFTKSTLTIASNSKAGYCGRVTGQAASYSDNAYIDLPFTVASGYTFNPSSVSVKVNVENATDNMKAKVAIIDNSLNVVSNELSCVKSTDNSVSFASGAFTGKLYSGTVHIRIYLYGVTSKYAYIKSPVTITGTVAEAATPTCVARTFKSGEKIYFKDQESNFDFNALWKVSSGQLYAYFWNDDESEKAWSNAAGTCAEGDWNEPNAIYELTVPGSGKEYTHVLFTRGKSQDFTIASDKTWDKTEDQTPCEGKNLFYVYKTKYADHIYKGDWGNFTPAGKTVYFDNRNVTDWTTAYVRIGHGSYSSAWGPMTKVAGTRNLYSQTTSKWASHTDFAIANKAGWTEGNHIDQPEKTYSNGSWSGSADKMTKQTNYQQYAIENDVYLCPKATSVSEHDCQFYQVTNANSTTSSRIDEGTAALSLPSYTVTSSASHCIVTMEKYNNDAGSSTTALASGGTVLPTQYVKVTVTPDANYQFESVEVTGAGTVTAAAAGTPGVYYITGDATITATCTCVALAVNIGGTAATPAEGEPLGTAYGTLTCSATTGVIASYQWKQNTSAITEGAVNAEGTGATTASFSPNPESAGTYYYYCVATDACGNSANTSFSGAFKFNAATYTVTYNKNGDGAGGAGSVTGTVPSDATSYTSGQRPVVKGPGDLAWDGHTFIGWNDKADGSGTYYSEKANFAISASKTLYAQWRTASSCPGSAGGTVFSLSMNNNTSSAIAFNYGESKLLSSYATIQRGDASFTDIRTSNDPSGTKATITKASPAKLKIEGNDVTIMLFLDCALQQGDVLTFTETNNRQLYITTTPSRATTIATTSNSYTIPAESPLIGKRVIYLWRNSSTYNIDAITITRPASVSNYTGLSVTKDPSEGSASAPTISATSVAVGSGVTVEAGAAASGYVFTGWTSENGTFADANSLSTTFTPNADNAVATAHYSATKTIVIKFQHNGNTTGWTIQGKTTYPADQTATINVDGDWVVMTFSNVYAVSNIDLAYSGGDWDYLNTSTKITDDACYNWTGTAISCAELTAIEANTLYQAADMANITFTSSDQWFAGLSTNSKFKVYGDGTSTSAFGKNENHSVEDDIDTKNFTSALYITAADNTSSASDPTKGAIEFITPSTAGTLYLYLNTDKSGLSIKEKGASSSTSLSGAAYKKIDVDANTHYFINGAGDKRGLYGIKFIPAATYTVTYNGSSADGGNVPVDGNSYTSGSTVTVLGNTGSLTRSIEGDAATFYGWNTNSNMYGGTHYNAEGTFSITANTTLYAVWGYTITWDLNDGDWVDYTAPNHYIYGQGLTLPTAAKISKSGYTFDHWELDYNHSTITAIADDATGNVTLNAIWTAAASSYSVTYNGNDNTGGSVPTDATSYSAGDIVTVKGNTGSLVKTGQTFLGWSTSATASSGTFYPAGYKFEMPASNVTLYAVWGSAAEEKYYYGQVGIADGALVKGAANTLMFFTNEGGVIASSTALTMTTSNLGTGPSCYYNSNDLTHTGLNKSSNWGTGSGSNKYIRGLKWANGKSYTLGLGTKAATSIMFYGWAGAADKTLTIGGVEYTSTGTSFFSNDFTKVGNFTGNVTIACGGDFYGILVITISTGAASNFTVSFNMNGHGSAIDAIANVPSGSKIGKPIPDPAAVDWEFGGWYNEAGCTSAFDFATTTITANKTLYAKWTNCAPTVTTQPVAASYAQDATATALTVAANDNGGGELHYQWWVKENDLDEETGSAIPGETGTSFTPSTELLGTSYYYCVVSNDCGNVFSNTAGITITDARPNPKAVWDVDVPTHGGKGFSFSVEVNKNDDSDWDGTLDASMLTLSSEAVLGTVTVDNTGKIIRGTYGVKGSATSPVTFYLLLPATASQAAARLDYDQSFTECVGGSGDSYDIRVRKTTTKDGNYYHWANTDGWISQKIASSFSSEKASTKMGESEQFDSIYNTNAQYVWVRTYHANINKVRIYADFRANDMTVSNVYKHTDYFSEASKYIVGYTAVYNDDSDAANLGDAAQGYVDITLEEPMNANDIVLVKFNDAKVRTLGAVLTEGRSGGSLETSLVWSNSQDNGATLEKREDAVDFTITANRGGTYSDNANASLGTISYSSSNTSVATVNAATGQVTIADNIDFGSETYKTTTITATLAASGCYKRCVLTYVLQVNKYVCTEAVGTVSIQTDNGCSGKVLAVSGYEAGAAIQWYKDGEVIPSATNATTYNATEGGTYYVVTHGECDAVSNEIKISFGTATATKIVDEWYVKNGRRTPDIALVQTENATSFTVTSGGSPIDNIGGCKFYLGEDGIIYLKGQQDDGTEPNGLTAGVETITITASACGAASGLDIVIHKQEQRGDGKPEIAFVVDGTLRKDGGTATSVLAAKTSERPIWTFLSTYYSLTGCNAYWSVNSKELRQYYSQFDAILITDDPNTSTEGTGGVSYVKAFGTMVDVRPVLTMEAYVGKFKDGGWHVYNATPSSPNPRQVEMKLECKNHDIFVGLNPSTMDNVRTETINGDEYWFVTMVDTTQSPYHNTKDDYEALPALQGFDKTKFSNMLGVGTIFEEKLQAGVERQEEPAARMMILGIQNNAMAALTTEGKMVVKNALDYLLKTDMEDVNDCANYFLGTTNNQWNVASNWSRNEVPDFETRARILRPVVVPNDYSARVARVDIAPGGPSKKLSGAECTGSLTISPLGALVVSGKVSRVQAPYYGVNDLMPTEVSDVAILSGTAGNGTLIMDDASGENKAYVQMYSKAVKSENTTWQYIGIPHSDVGNAMDNYYDSWLYSWSPSAGWEVVPRGAAVTPWTGYCITYPTFGHKYEMTGTLVATADVDIDVPANSYQIIGNSWVAPIQIANFEDEDFGDIPKTVYFFNTGSDTGGSGAVSGNATGETRWAAGTYVAVPIHMAEYTGEDKIIPSMQGFYVANTGSAGTLHLDYDKLVRQHGVSNYIQGQMHAPRRIAKASNDPVMLKMIVRGSRYDDRLIVAEREDFTKGHDDGWDGAKWDGSTISPTIWSQNDEGGVESVTATPDMEGTIIGFRAGEDNEYTFHFEYDDMAEPLFLLDMDERMYVRILTGTTYTFTCADKGEHNRFLLTRKAPGIPTGCEPIDGGGGPKAMKFIKDNKLYILLNGVLYDATGKVVE